MIPLPLILPAIILHAWIEAFRPRKGADIFFLAESYKGAIKKAMAERKRGING